MMRHANAHRIPSRIKEGDLVYLKIRPHRQVSMPSRLHPKLAARFYGPYLVVKQIGTVGGGQSVTVPKPWLVYSRKNRK